MNSISLTGAGGEDSTSYFYNQLEELAVQQKNSENDADPETPDSDEEPASVPDQECRESIQEDHPFLKYAVKLGYQISLAQDALARLGSSATTDSLLKAVLYDYAALNPNRKNRHHRRNFHNRTNNQFNNQFNGSSQHMTNGKPYPSYMITQDSYQRFNGHHPDITALKSALSQGPGNMPYMKTISPPTSSNMQRGKFHHGTYSNGNSYHHHHQNINPFNCPQNGFVTPTIQTFTPPSSQELYDQLNANAQPFQPFAYSLESSPENLSLASSG